MAGFAILLWLRERRLLAYGCSIALCLAGLFLRLAFSHHLSGAPFVTFIPAIVLATFAGGVGPGLVAVALAAGFGSHFFFPPSGWPPVWPSSTAFMTTFFVVTGTMVFLVNATVKDTVKLSQSSALLRAANENLEARIAERTAELLAAQENLRQSQKMEAVGQLTGGIAHDFNNLLTSITGCLEVLQSRVTQGRTDGLETYIGMARETTERAAILTHRLLAFSRRQALDARATNVNSLIQGMENLIRRSIGPGITLDVAPAPGLWTSFIDPHQLEQALLNLCINASDAMPHGGRLIIKTANIRTPSPAFPNLPPGDYLALTVTDTGTGMTSEVIERAFEPFFTTKPVGRGTGLGLSMIYGFARQSNGDVQIISAPGQGTSVILYFPRHDGEPEAASAEFASHQPVGDGAGETVLVVDDEPSVRALVADVLEDQGYTILSAEDAAEAMACLESASPISLLLTDIGLPGGVNGIELAEQARARRPNLKILVITGYGKDTLAHRDNMPTGTEILPKPFTMAALAARVREILTKEEV